MSKNEEQRAGERMVLYINGIAYAFRWCPPGTFMMGSPESEEEREYEEREDNETQHQVTLSCGFWMLETQVTQNMWESVMGNDPSYFNGANRPVEQVSWNDCQRYITKMNAHLAGTPAAPAGYKFSLPTEAQWEYACRAGTTTEFNFGDTLNGDKANTNGYGKGYYYSYDRRTTTEVGSYPANAWGLYDMHGNVWEWCQDYDDYYDYYDDDDHRVIRGGSWASNAGSCGSAFRSSSDQAIRNAFIGCRLALVRAE